MIFLIFPKHKLCGRKSKSGMPGRKGKIVRTIGPLFFYQMFCGEHNRTGDQKRGSQNDAPVFQVMLPLIPEKLSPYTKTAGTNWV